MIALAITALLALLVTLELLRRDRRDGLMAARRARYAPTLCEVCGREISPAEPRVSRGPASPEDFGGRSGRSLQRHLRCR
jgi:hypothetical protein